MLKLSKPASQAWKYAENEIKFQNFEFVTVDCLFIGIFGIDRALKLSDNEEDYISFKSECCELNQILKDFNLEFADLRKGLQGSLVKGNSKPNQKQILRDEACKEVSSLAMDLAAEDNVDVRCIHLLKAILFNPTENIIALFKKLHVDIDLFKEKLKYIQDPPEVKIDKSFGMPINQDLSNTLLGKYGKNLTELAKEGKLDPVIGRDEELLDLERTLDKYKKNNPLIIGEAGIGKTALVHALAIKIANGEASDHLNDKTIIELSVASLVSGTSYRGSFEERIEEIVNDVKEHPNVILFIDEIHTILGAGTIGDGGLDASNILKPALASRELTLIGSTTLKEYTKYFERDAAFKRRFQPIKIDEPSKEDTLNILKGLRETYENYHKLIISDEAIEEAINLSVRYMTNRYLPDKALDVIDEACSRKNNPKVKGSNSKKLKSEGIASTNFDDEDVGKIVTKEDIKDIVTELTGIPIPSENSEFEKIKTIESFLKEHIVGQDEAIMKISNRVKKSSLGIQDPNRPLGVFLFLGSTGVGKTYISKLLAKFLFGDEKNLIRLDMSEYMDKTAVNKIVGAGPGYVGYDDGSYLFDQIRDNPYSVVLIDELEKADSQVLDIFLQIFDEGRLTNSKGITINAKNCYFIMTSNISIPTYDSLFNNESIHNHYLLESLSKHFRPEFVNRIDEVIKFNDLNEENFEGLVTLALKEIKQRLLIEKDISVKYDEEVITYLAFNGFDENFGARYLNRFVENAIENPIAELMLDGKLNNGDTLFIGLSDKLTFNVQN